MDFGELVIYDFSGFRFYYALSDRTHILVETSDAIIDLVSFEQYPVEKIKALIRLTSPDVEFVHDNLEVRLDKRLVENIVSRHPEYAWALKDQLQKMSIFASNLRFHLDELLNKIDEILGDYSGTSYHETKEEKKHFVRRIISNFDRYVELDELPLNWVNFIDLVAQIELPKTRRIVAVNTWRSFIMVHNYDGSPYPNMYYPYSNTLFDQLSDDQEVELINLDEGNIDTFLDEKKCRVHNSAVTTTNPIKYI